MQMALNYTKINKEYMILLWKSYARSILYGLVFGTLFHSSNCIMWQVLNFLNFHNSVYSDISYSKLTGRIYYYNLGIMTGIISGLAIFVESDQNRHLNTLIFFNLVWTYNNIQSLLIVVIAQIILRHESVFRYLRQHLKTQIIAT